MILVAIILFRFAEKNNLPILKNVSLPRVGAMRVIMENIGYSTDENCMGDGEGSEMLLEQNKLNQEDIKLEDNDKELNSYNKNKILSGMFSLSLIF